MFRTASIFVQYDGLMSGPHAAVAAYVRIGLMYILNIAIFAVQIEIGPFLFIIG